MNEKQTSKEEREKLLDRIKKLLALSTSDNQAEAELAAQRAQELIRRHNVDEVELDRGNVERIEHLFKKRRVEKWVNYLLHIIAQNNFCQSCSYGAEKYFNKDLHKVCRKEAKYVIIGRPLNLQMVTMMFDYLSTVAERLAEEHVKGCTRGERTIKRNNFLVGFVLALKERFEAQTKAWLDEDADFRTAMVRVQTEDDRDIEKLKKEIGENWTTKKPQYAAAADADSQAAGRKAGREVAIDRQKGSQRQITGRVA